MVCSPTDYTKGIRHHFECALSVHDHGDIRYRSKQPRRKILVKNLASAHHDQRNSNTGANHSAPFFWIFHVDHHDIRVRTGDSNGMENATGTTNPAWAIIEEDLAKTPVAGPGAKGAGDDSANRLRPSWVGGAVNGDKFALGLNFGAKRLLDAILGDVDVTDETVDVGLFVGVKV